MNTGQDNPFLAKFFIGFNTTRYFQYDTDGSGQIEFPEFCNMMSDKMNAANDEDMIRMAFRVLDKDGSGTISAKSFTHLMTHIGNTNMG